MVKLKIDPEFRDKIPPMTDEQFNGLREDILKDGYVRDPLVVWQEENILLDGHHRWRIICENWETLKDKFTIDYKNFDNRWAALEWICRNQLNKHNLNDEQITYITGEMYKARKKSVGEHKGNQHVKMECSHNENIPKGPNRTAIAIAKELGVGKETVIRAEKFHDGVDAIREVSKEAADKVMAGGSGATKKEVKAFPTMEPEEKQQFVENIISGTAKTKRSSDRPKPVGRTKEMRESRAMTKAIVADMYNPDSVPEFTIDLLIDDIQMNAQNYVSLLRNTLLDRSTLLTPENKPIVADAIEKYAIQEIIKLKETVAK